MKPVQSVLVLPVVLAAAALAPAAQAAGCANATTPLGNVPNISRDGFVGFMPGPVTCSFTAVGPGAALTAAEPPHAQPNAQSVHLWIHGAPTAPISVDVTSDPPGLVVDAFDQSPIAPFRTPHVLTFDARAEPATLTVWLDQQNPPPASGKPDTVSLKVMGTKPPS
jgi:hypothetical protein